MLSDGEKYNNTTQATYDEPVDRVILDFVLSRRGFVQVLGAGLLMAVSEAPVLGQRPGAAAGVGAVAAEPRGSRRGCTSAKTA